MYVPLLLISFSFLSTHVWASVQSFDRTCTWQGNTIHEVQGSRELSPLRGEKVTVAGTVSGVFPLLNGFTIQTPTGYEDRNSQTSEGLFIWTGGSRSKHKKPQVGATLTVSGKVSEFHGMTQVKASGWQKLCSRNFPIQPTEIVPKQALESYEAMQVVIPKSRISSIAQLKKFGTFSVVSSSSQQFLIDDGSNKAGIQDPYKSIQFKPKPGHTLETLKGILFYSFDQFRIHLQDVGQVSRSFNIVKKAALTAPTNSGDVRILNVNAENYFNGMVRSGKTQYLKYRGPRNWDEYSAKKEKLQAVIKAVAADVLVLQEIENDLHQKSPAIVDLISSLGDLEYRVLQFKSRRGVGFGDDQITQYILVKSDSKLKSDGPLRSYSSSKGRSGRPLVLQQLRWESGDQHASFVLATSHLKSKRNNCGADEGCTLKRRRQAQQIDGILRQEQRQSKMPILWMGDFNSQLHEPTMQYLSQQHWKSVLPKQSYSYVYRGQQQLLDHVLWKTNKNGKSSAIRVEGQVWHLSEIPHPGLGTHSVSDHEPVITDIWFKRFK